MSLNIFSVPSLAMVAFLVVSLQSISYAQVRNNTIMTWAIEKNSTLQIQGKSNINSFSCSNTASSQKETIVCENLSKQVTLSGSLVLDVKKFDCNNSIITKDLRKTLKADEHPNAVIRFMSLECLPGGKGQTQSLKGWVLVELAGVSKRFQIDYSILKQESSLLLNGTRKFSFYDFQLKPPSKFGGLVQVKDDFTVTFKLALKEL